MDATWEDVTVQEINDALKQDDPRVVARLRRESDPVTTLGGAHGPEAWYRARLA